MNTTAWICVAFAGGIWAFATLVALRHYGRKIADAASRRVEAMCAQALAEPTRVETRRLHAEIEAEYRELVAAAHNDGNA